MAKKTLTTLLVVLMCIALLCACTPTNAPETNAPETNAPATNAPATNAPENNDDPTPAGTQEVVLSDYFGQDVWEDDGGDVYVEEDQIVFDNGFMGDFAALRLTETAQNVTYKFTLQLEDIPTDVSVDEGTWWDAELMILARSALAAPGWEEGQTGYSLTAWGDMSEVFIGRSGHDDAFGSIQWNVTDGQPHDIEFSLENNEDNTTVTITLTVDGEVVFTTVDDGSIVKEGRTPLFPDAGGLTIRCKYVKATIS